MKGLLSISLVVILALSLSIVALPANKVMAAADEWYVSPTGDDSMGNGTEVNPWKTIVHAISQATSGDTIHVAPGNYTENIEMKIEVIIQGSGADVTTINGTSSGPVVSANNVNPPAKLDGFTITNGSTNVYGGGIVLVSASPTISNCIITSNSAYLAGGGIAAYNYSSPTIINCVITGNRVTSNLWGGGGIFAYLYSSPTIVNCTITSNNATLNGGGIWGSTPSPNITNCIITSNNAGAAGGGIYVQGTPSPTINYNDVWGNLPDDYSGCGPGPKAITPPANPQFVDPGAGDYHLRPGSPCIDAGDNISVPLWLTTDLEGNPRIADGDGDGKEIVDMGAYEASAQLTEISIDIKPGSDSNSINLKSKGVIPVAILTTADFDAATVDPDTVLFADTEPVRWILEDVDSDSDLDLLLHFRTQDLNLDKDSTHATLTGNTYNGYPIEGTDMVNIVPKGKS